MSTFREPVFDFETLTNSDTVITWLTRTNQIITGMNSLYVADIFEGDGICTTRADGIVTINIDAGPGLGFNTSNELTLSFANVTELTTASSTVSPILSTDYVYIGRSNGLFKVKSDSILPTVIKHNHTFEQITTFSAIYTKGAITAVDTGGLAAKGAIAFNYASNNTPKGWNINSFVVDGGVNLPADGFIRNIFPEYITQSDYVPGWDPNTTNYGEDAFFTNASFNFATTNYPQQGDDELSVGGLQQNKITMRFYTGIEGNNGDGLGYISNPSVYGTSTLRWPMLWTMEFAEGYFALTGSEGYRIADGGSGSVYSFDAFKYEYLDQNVLNNLFTITGKIRINNLANSEQFISSPSGASNKVPLTGSDGLINKKFTNRIVTTDYLTLSVGSIVYVGTITDGDITYAKAQASPAGNYDVIGIVESISGGSATIVLNGEFELNGVSSLEPGIKYYLSQTTAGQYVAEGTYSTGIIKPIFVAISSSKGILIGANENSNISSISVTDQALNEETVEIDSPNFDLKFVAGPNIDLDINTNNEVEIRVVGITGSQDTFKTITVNGVGADGDGSVVADLPNDTLTFTSSTLSITANSTTDTINFEAPNAFRTFKFSDGTDYSYVPESTSDTLQLIAGDGVSFTQNTDDSIIISATVEGGVAPENITYSGAYQVLVSDSSSDGMAVSLLGGDANSFTIGYGLGTTNIALDHNKQITRVAADEYTYDSTVYHLNPSNDWPSATWSKYLPDELAGYMVGRITPSALGDDITFPDNKIRRLSRRDVRHFLGMAQEGFIDNIGSVFNRWTIDNGGTYVTANDKSGTLNIVAGTGISLSNPGAPDRIVITNTGVAQNAFGSVIVKNYNGSTIDSFDANSSSDSFTLKSGRFVTIDTDTNSDTATFEISIPDDYSILGNPGTTDGMGAISLASSSYSLVGRSGGPIEAITADTLKWTGITSGTLTSPEMQLPYFGAVQVGTTPTPTILNAYGVGKGALRIEAGTGVSLTSDTSTNTITINSTGGAGTTTENALRTLFANSSQYNFSSTFNRVRLNNGNGITITSISNTTDAILEFNLSSIPNNSVLANTNNIDAVPTHLSFATDQILGRLGGSGALGAYPIKSGTGTTLRERLDIRHYGKVQISDGTTVTDLTALGSGTATSTTGATLRLRAGPNITLSGSLSNDSTSIITITGANPSLILDTTPEFAGTTFSGSGRQNVIKYGDPFIGSTPSNKVITEQHRTYDVSNVNNEHFITFRELQLPLINSSLSTFGTVTSPVTGQSIKADSGNATQYMYAGGYTLNVRNLSAGSTTQGNLTFVGDAIRLSATGTIHLEGTGSTVNLNAKVLRGTSNTFKFGTSGTESILSSTNTSGTVSSTNFIMHSGSSFMLRFGATPITQLLFTDEDQDGEVRITTTGTGGNKKVVFDTDVDFGVVSGSTRTIDFANATIVGLTVSSHSSTHDAVDSASSNTTVSVGADAIQAWQVGGVARGKPTMLNTIGIVNGDGQYDFDLSAVSKALLYSGSTTYNTTNYNSSITASIKGPLYLVVPSDTDTTNPAAWPPGPPGQIILIRKP
jgi:hypothetical protein